jgi:hypothetical protein
MPQAKAQSNSDPETIWDLVAYQAAKEGKRRAASSRRHVAWPVHGVRCMAGYCVPPPRPPQPMPNEWDPNPWASALMFIVVCGHILFHLLTYWLVTTHLAPPAAPGFGRCSEAIGRNRWRLRRFGSARARSSRCRVAWTRMHGCTSCRSAIPRLADHIHRTTDTVQHVASSIPHTYDKLHRAGARSAARAYSADPRVTLVLQRQRRIPSSPNI